MRILSLLLLNLLASGMLRASGGTKGSAQDTSSASLEAPMNEPLSQSALKSTSRAIFQRIIQARLFHDGTWTLEGTSQTPVTVSRTLASLQPSFITGLLRLPAHGDLSNAEIEAFSTVRSAVLAANKNCRFDVLINVGEEHSPESFVRRMKECTTLLHPDGWTLYVAPDSVSVDPEVFEEAIAAAHDAGQMVGYDGPLSLIPGGVDFIVLQASNLKVNRRAIDLLHARQRVPLIVELPTTFGTKNSPEVISYVEEMDTSDRTELITQLAENQSSWGYRFAYPVFYPLYPAKHVFDSTKDSTLLVSIRALLARLN